jgi:hypothetical protein
VPFCAESTASFLRPCTNPPSPASAPLALEARHRRQRRAPLPDSTPQVIKFLVHYKAWLRLLVSLPLAALLIPLSKVSRSLAVRVMYWLAFRGVRVEKAERIARERLGDSYVRDLQDPAASAVLDADEAVVITASPTFMARPWLGKYLGVSESNVYGADLEVVNGRFTGKTGDLPIGQKKVPSTTLPLPLPFPLPPLPPPPRSSGVSSRDIPCCCCA